ncbi:MAG: alpha/beta fold hydrolase [Acidimicrobiales bacterium]
MSIWSTEAPVPIVFLHGWATSTQMTWVEPGWFELVKEGGRRPLGYDLLGHGEADKPDEVEAYRDLVTPVVDQLPFGVDDGRQIDIVGYSLGARTALDLTLRHPQLVRRLVLSGVGRNLIEGSALGDESDRAGADYRFEGLLRSAGEEAAAVLQKVGEAQSARTDRYFTAEQLATVTQPVLLVIGSEDFAGPPEPLAELLPNVEVTILPGVDHFSLPKQFGFIDAALEFLDCVPSW